MGTETESGEFILNSTHQLEANGKNSNGETLFRLDLEPPLAGLQYYKLRMYPYNTLLSHPLEVGCMIWL